MISIIVSSRQPEQLFRLSENIEQSIGVPFELLSCDNGQGSIGLCKVYNDFAQIAQFDILLFLHEDVLFHTKDWGNILIRIFRDRNVGLVGVLGADTLTKVPSGWAKQDARFNKGALKQHGEIFSQEDHIGLTSVLAIDGVFMATTKVVWNESKFDEISLKGFHGYDFDFSMQVAQQYQVLVCNEILIEHFSKGSFNRDWINTTILLNKKWSHQLPKSLVVGLTKAEWDSLEFWQAEFILKLIHMHGLGFATSWYVLQQFVQMKFSRLFLALKLFPCIIFRKQ